MLEGEIVRTPLPPLTVTRHVLEEILSLTVMVVVPEEMALMFIVALAAFELET